MWWGTFSDKQQHVNDRQVYSLNWLLPSDSLLWLSSVYSPHYMALSVNLQPSGTQVPWQKSKQNRNVFLNSVWPESVRVWVFCVMFFSIRRSCPELELMIICFICFPLLSSSACPVGQFKSGTEGQCTGCPGFSHATIRGASVCECRSGYLRAESDAPDTPCTSKYAEKSTYARIHMQIWRC